MPPKFWWTKVLKNREFLNIWGINSTISLLVETILVYFSYKWHIFFLNKKNWNTRGAWHLATYSLSRETTSRSEIEPSITPFRLGNSPLSSGSLRSSRITSNTCCKVHDHALYMPTHQGCLTSWNSYEVMKTYLYMLVVDSYANNLNRVI